MKNWKKKLTVALAATLAAGTLAGCGGTSLEEYPSTVAATYGDENIYLDEANFFLRYQQWVQEAMYWDYMSYFGYTDLWAAPSGDGDKTMADSLKEAVMAELWQTRVLVDHAEEYGVSLTEDETARIAEAVTALHENLAEEFFQYVNNDDARVTEWFTQNALAVKVWDAVKQSAEVTVSDEECQMFTIEYALVTEPSETEESTAADETAAAEETEAEEELTGEALADEVLARLEAGETFESISEELGVTSSTGSYLKTATDNVDTLFVAGVTLTTGEVRKVAAENGWYVIQCVSDLDEDATADKKASVEDEKREAYFEEVYAGWAAESPAFDVKNCWDDVKFSGEKIYVETTTEADSTEETSADETSVEETAAEASEEETSAAN